MNVSNSIFWRCQPLCARKLRFAEARIYQAPQHTEFFGEGESLVTSIITAKGDTTTLTMTMTMRFPGSP